MFHSQWWNDEDVLVDSTKIVANPWNKSHNLIFGFAISFSYSNHKTSNLTHLESCMIRSLIRYDFWSSGLNICLPNQYNCRSRFIIMFISIHWRLLRLLIFHEAIFYHTQIGVNSSKRYTASGEMNLMLLESCVEWSVFSKSDFSFDFGGLIDNGYKEFWVNLHPHFPMSQSGL